jgi:glycosyltransferase involved in cell wall biosynthesis
VIQTPPLISIITVVFNGEASIEKCMASVKAQNYSALEYIVIDGGSTDNTLNIILSNKLIVSHWISEKDKGIADAMNKGLAIAKGDLIGFLNADDWLEPHALEKIAAAYVPNTVIYGDVRFWKNNHEVKKTQSNHLKLRHGMTIAHPAAYVPKTIYTQFGTFDTSFHVAFDYDFILRLYMANVPFKNMNEVLVNMSLGGLSDRKWLHAIKEELRSKNRYFNKAANLYYFIKQFMYLFVEKIFR